MKERPMERKVKGRRKAEILLEREKVGEQRVRSGPREREDEWEGE